MITEPTIENRDAQPYVGIRSRVAMSEISAAMDRLGEVFGWLERHREAPTGAPFIRYLQIDMETTLEIDVAVPVASVLAGDGEIITDELPAGRYVTFVYTGDYRNLVGITAELLRWGDQRGVRWDRWPASPSGENWRARIETYLTNPAEEPDPAKWQTELAFRLAS